MNEAKEEKIKANIKVAEDGILQLMELSEEIINGDPDDVLKFNHGYTDVIKELNKIIEALRKSDKNQESTLWEKVDSLYDDVNYIYDETSVQINSVIAAKTQELTEYVQKSQGVQLAVFSIVLSILAFVLTNGKILAAEGINFKNILLVNLSFILSTDILFSLIYLFMGPIFYSKRGRLRIFTFIVLPIILVTAIVLVSFFA